MGDPFEEAGQVMSGNPVGLREASVQQAVTFLNDPRVKGAEPSKALTFLRGKGISEDELREAFRRCGIPFPHAQQMLPPSMPFPPIPAPPFAPHGMPLMQFHRPPPQRPSWVSVFLGITAAAGLYTAVRELLRRHVVPLYFPDAARVAEERRRRDEFTLHSQEMQIAELRERIQELVETSKRTSEKVDSLTHSISSSVAQREREISQNSELRDAIRNLSHSITASPGTDISVAGSAAFPKDGRRDSMFSTGFSPYMAGDRSQKRDSLAFSHSENFNDMMTPPADGNYRTPVRPPSTKIEDGTDTSPGPSSSANDTKASPRDADNLAKQNEDDDFMALPPAEVEDSWGQGLVKKENEEEQNDPTQEDGEKLLEKKDAGKENGSDHVEVAAGSTTTAEEGVDEFLCDSTNFKSVVGANAARQLFENDLMNEAKMVMGKSPERRVRPLSMPQMDVPLSDGED